ncbi:hypothetical protein F5884DRAFT_880968 [Xylogone sp. PMI_703]|nr:hypothetical protein F5884DRAFT_880968 [Xylogone sp. PMI_703]
MAPLTFDDKINISSMVGTWLGTLFTLVGLIAVVAQLRSLLRDFSSSREEIIKESAGDWSILLNDIRRLDAGIVEGKAPSLSTWIKHYYTEGKSVTVCPYERKSRSGQSLSGQSSWSKLFCRLQIRPDELLSLPRLMFDELPISFPQLPVTADVQIDGPKISYGLPADEFIVLLILSGFSPSDFSSKETRKATSHMGHMYLATHSDPFSQVAHLDGASWNCFSTFMGEEWHGRYADRLNVQHCLDLALGILRFEYDGKPGTLLFPSREVVKSPFLPRTFPHADAQQALQIRRNLTELTGGSMNKSLLFDVVSTTSLRLDKTFPLNRSIKSMLSKDYPFEAKLDLVFEVAFSIMSLKPWGLFPVVSPSIVNTLCHLLKGIFPNLFTGTNPTSQLIERFRGLPVASKHKLPPHRTREKMDSDLDSLSEVGTRNFSGLSSYCSLYYDAMIYVFENHGLSLDDVEIGLAAYCATRFAFSTQFPHLSYDDKIVYVNESSPADEKMVRRFVRQCLKGSPMDGIHVWAYEILATYLHAWLQEAHLMSDDYRSNFRRRVFLG